MEKVQDTTPVWQKGVNCISDHVLSTHRCHLFPPNSLAEIASHTCVEHWNLWLYIH